MPNTCLNNNHLPGQFYVPTSSGFWTIFLLTLFKMCPTRKRTLLALSVKKILGRIFFIKSNDERVSFLLHQMLSLFSTINLVYVLEINIFGRDYSSLNNLFQRYQSPVHMQGLLWRIGTISDAIWCTWKKL